MTKILRAGSDIDETKPLAAINFVAKRLPPFWMVEIPLHGLFETSFETFLRMPAKLALDLARVDGVATIVSRPVRNKTGQFATRIFGRPYLVEQIADALDNLQIRAFAKTADIVFMPDLTAGEYQHQRADVILGIKPIADIQPSPYTGNFLPSSALRMMSGISFSGKWNGP